MALKLGNISPETRLHLLLARPQLQEDMAEAARALVAQLDAPERFVDTALRKMSLPVIHSHFEEIGFRARFPESAARARAQVVHIAARKLSHIAELRRFHETCIEPEALRCAYFKGPTLEPFYASPSQRAFRDIDVLLAELDLNGVIARMREAGFRVILDGHRGLFATTDRDVRAALRYHKEISLLSPGGAVFEVHTRLDRHVPTFRTGEILAHLDEVKTSSMTLPTLPLPLHAVYLCYHACRHMWSHMHWLADLNAVVEGGISDLDAVREEAARLGLWRSFEACLELQSLAAAPETWTEVDPERPGAQLLAACIENLHGGRETEVRIRKRGVKGLRDWRAPEGHELELALRETLFTLTPKITQYTELPLPDRLQGLYYLTRPVYAARHALQERRTQRTRPPPLPSPSNRNRAPLRMLAVSEHYWPRLGGTTNYVHETCRALAAQGIEIDLLVPGPRPASVSDAFLAGLPYRVSWIDAGYPEAGDPPRSARYRFCELVNAEALRRARPGGADAPDIVHVLFGLFLMEVLDTDALRTAGICTAATVHNVPPMECARSWPGAPLSERAADRARLSAVAIKNRTRLQAHSYDFYVVPSQQVADMLRQVLPGAVIRVIGHGVNDALLARMTPPANRAPEAGSPLRLFTAGGWAPHKRQILIPDTIKLLEASGISLIWERAGPASRVGGYHAAVLERARALGVADRMYVHEALAFGEFAACYDRANLYVQPSTEEGFCLTALDAAAAGLPVIGCPAGALPEICAVSGGRLVPSTEGDLATAIEAYVLQASWPDAPADNALNVRDRFTWRRAAETLARHIRTTLQDNAVPA